MIEWLKKLVGWKEPLPKELNHSHRSVIRFGLLSEDIKRVALEEMPDLTDEDMIELWEVKEN